MKKTIILALTLAIGATLGFAGCKKGDKKSGAAAFSCESANKKTVKCADELAAVMIKKLGSKIPAKMIPTFQEKMKKRFASGKMLDKCKKEMAKGDTDPKEKKKFDEMKTCFAKSSCGDFAACFADKVN
jgi:hypothetical protein